jgi:hypothetical protein
LVFEPLSNEQSEHRRRYRQNVMVPGERHAFFPPGELNANINSLPETYRAIRLVGSMNDAAGKRHVVDESFADLAEWRELLHSAGRAWSPPEPERRMGEAIGKALDTPFKRLATELESIRRVIRELRPVSEDDRA